MENSWGSGLPCDLARCIGDRLDVLSRIRFRAVCRSWRVALPAGSVASIPSPLVLLPTTVPAPSLPLRSVAESCGGGTSSNPFTLHVVDFRSGLRCVGSSGGWLAVTDSTYVIRLVNALTLQVAAWLPPLPRNTEIRRIQDLGHVDPNSAFAYDYDDAARGLVAFTEIRRLHQDLDRFDPYFAFIRSYNYDDRHLDHTIHKVAFTVKPSGVRGSSYAHSAAALHRSARLGKGLALTFTRAGWDHWEWRQPAFFHDGEDKHFDIAYCQRSGVYYVVTPPGSVWILDMSAPVPTLEPLVRCHESFRELTVAQRRHAVVFSDDSTLSQMYMVIVVTETQEQRVIVHKYTAAEPWSVVSDLGGRALLIANAAQSVSVIPTAASPRWLKPDCVYWMTGDEDDYAYERGMAPVWRLHVPTNTMDMFVGAEYEHIGAWLPDWHYSVWLTPSLT